MSRAFPLPFTPLRTMSGGKKRSYVIGGMFTAAYSGQAERLTASCEKFGLPYVVQEVPTVHRSISGRGTDDLSYTKPNFIRHLLETQKKTILYLDADCEIMAEPELIGHLVESGRDFAIYNWYADEYTDRFVPIEPGSRLYRFAGSIDWFSTRQLGCSGLVQFYRNSFAAKALLARWHRTIATFPGCADDAALTFTFNNLPSWLLWFLKVHWLPKAYARIPYWIYAEPVINHPDAYVPGQASGFTEIKDPGGRKVVYRSLLERRKPTLLFPRDCLIDTEQHTLRKLVDGEIVPLAPTAENFWL
jgi:hypothetical protein